jgi:hypothetical protein
MSGRVRPSSSVGVVALTLFLLASGCSEINRPPCPPWCRHDWRGDFRLRTSPQNLLHNLAQAYEHRNIAEYESLLAKNGFEFVLSEESHRPDLPDSWGRDVEIQLHRCLFDAEHVQTLTLDFTVGDVEWDPVFGMPTVLIRHVDIYVYGSTPGHPTDFSERRVRDGSSRFWFVKNPWTTGAHGDSVWTIVRWEDSEHGSGEDSLSWGECKALCR